MSFLRSEDRWPVGAVGFILAVSTVWWGFALWQIPGAPEWVDRARAVCFNVDASGLPDAKGWLMLIGQPPSMVILFAVIWRTEAQNTLDYFIDCRGGRMLLGWLVLGVSSMMMAASARVADARVPDVTLAGAEAPSTYPRLDRIWPDAAGLVAQDGLPFTHERLEGRPAFVTFAFGHCETVCPAVVHAARGAREQLGRELPIVVLTLDPWRDTPSRLPALVGQFMLDPAVDLMVSGDVEAVEAALDAWGIPRDRDTRTGDVTHPALVYLIDSDGTVAYASTGGPEQLSSLARRLR